MLKHSAWVLLALFGTSCSLVEDDDGDSDGPGDGNVSGNGGITPLGGNGGGTSGPVAFAGNGSGNSSSSAGNSGGVLDPDAAERLRDSACAGWSHEPELLPAVLQIVVDVSASMRETTRATGGRTKWEITRDALTEAVENLPESTSVGMLYYPNRQTRASDVPLDVTACVNTGAMIPIALLDGAGSDQRLTLTGSLRVVEPNGSTPTHDAYRYALEQGLYPSRAPGNRYMLLITDGAPTLALQCLGQGVPQSPQPTGPIVDEMSGARQNGVRTFIIGSPGSEVSVNGGDARPWMAEAAVMSGTANAGCSVNGPNFCHIDLTQVNDFAEALRAALAQVTGAIASCTYELPVPSGNQTLDLSQVNVIYTSPNGDAELIGRNDTPNCDVGWQLDGSNIVLCGSTCDTVQANSAASLELLFGCASAQVPPR
jgi:hypothetical protein